MASLIGKHKLSCKEIYPGGEGAHNKSIDPQGSPVEESEEQGAGFALYT
jgi:hypothetical protein